MERSSEKYGKSIDGGGMKNRYTPSMDHLSSLIPKVLRKRGLYDEANASMIVYRAKKWLEESHPEPASMLQPHALKDGTLTVICEHSLAQQEGTLLAPELLRFLQRDDQNAVREIRFIRK
ncbi:MAG: hypothetical protein Greene041662_191 [Candidatus Peregrinibacteria bacterium Greene0416_62]|nr:MAG: hypothetical protein Greene041662_191 [Candidatus Peregrinibacteria bacterium Greene0416_62]TSC99584.1 MAG: hypothetical protein Greene101449_581 [Candidatus Peregrinibacteria bacterium Greene1014_49]